jgi:hypothetical protein
MPRQQQEALACQVTKGRYLSNKGQGRAESGDTSEDCILLGESVIGATVT